MEKQYQKEVNLGKMLKTLAKKWVAVFLAFSIALVVGASVGFVAAITNKVYGVNLDFHVYKVSNVDEKGNTIVGTSTDYDDTTMNMVYQSLNSQTFIESIICNEQIHNAKGVTDSQMREAIKTAKEKMEALEVAKKELTEKQRVYLRTTRLAEKAKLAFELEQLGYEAVCLEYSNALQANAAIPGTVDLSENGEFMTRLNKQKEQYDAAKTYNNTTIQEAINAENAYEDCLQDITDLTMELNQAKDKIISINRNQPTYKEEIKDALNSIKVSYADSKDQTKSTIRVSIAVDKKVENSEEFANWLAEIVREELPGYAIEKIDFATARCELVNVLDNVDNVNKKKMITNPILFGVLGGVLVAVIVSTVILLKRKEEFVDYVVYESER